ncbi:hypothetical protein D3C79_797060 [compost metagenome]
MFRTFPAEAGLFPATERNRCTGESWGVECHHAVLQLIGNTRGAFQIICVNISSQTVLSFISSQDNFFFAVERQDCCHWAKGLFERDIHFISNVCQYGWQNEAATQVAVEATAHQAGAE